MQEDATPNNRQVTYSRSCAGLLITNSRRC